jgi:ubiquitin C-terminal hydrolase
MKRNFKDFENCGLTGLSNLGNTCFINATCQVLSHTYEFNQFLNKKIYKKSLNTCIDSLLITEWDELRQLMHSENCTIRPARFVNTIQKVSKLKNNELFSDFSQNDVPEFFLFMIDCFHTALARKVSLGKHVRSPKQDKIAQKCFEYIKNECSKDISEIKDLFYGIHLSQLKSLDLKKTYSTKPEQFNIINLAITDADGNVFESLQQCFDNYVKGEVLDGENQWYNEDLKCKMDVQKIIRYWSMPQILVIDLKRYNERNQKTRSLISFPLDNWDLSAYILSQDAGAYVYDLYAACNHSGIVFGGHYTSMIRNANGSWYEFDDGIVNKVDSPEENVITSKAYCLFYRKRRIQKK